MNNLMKFDSKCPTANIKLHESYDTDNLLFCTHKYQLKTLYLIDTQYFQVLIIFIINKNNVL